MSAQPHRSRRNTCHRPLLPAARRWAALLLATSGATAPAADAQPPAAPTPAPASPWSLSASLSVKEEYDNNVFLQGVTAQANRDSFVTTTIPSVGLKYSAAPAFNANLTYAPEIAFFHTEPTEDYVLHRMGLGFSGKFDTTEWDVQNNVIVIDGSDLGPTFTGPGGATAAGGPRIRDRRDATIFRGNYKLTQPVGSLLIRPVITAYAHDFRTIQKVAPGYQNYTDRDEYTGGVDLGTALNATSRTFVGYRFGVQDQSRLLNFPEQYGNTFHRGLVTVEGSPWKWAKAAISFGPEFRTYGDQVPATFGNHDVVNLYVDAALTLTPTPSDTVVASIKQLEQPGFSGRSTYTDLTYDLSWRHKVSPRLGIGLAGRAYSTDFRAPVVRDDWILSGSVIVSYNFTSHLQAEASYTREDAESRIPNTAGREYVRDVGALGLKYTFR